MGNHAMGLCEGQAGDKRGDGGSGLDKLLQEAVAQPKYVLTEDGGAILALALHCKYMPCTVCTGKYMPLQNFTQPKVLTGIESEVHFQICVDRLIKLLC